MQLIRVEFEVFGNVQGVLFRKYTQTKCKELGLRGWCMNTVSLSVRGVLEGENDRVEAMKNWLQNEGSPRSRIDNVVFENETKIEEELEDSDDEWDEWLSDNILERLGLQPRSIWMHPLNLDRFKNSEYVRICLPLRKYPEKFRLYFRMSISTFDYIHDAIKVDITKHSNRPSIPPAERLAVTLRYLSTGMSFVALSQCFLMNDYTVGLIVDEVWAAIWKHLMPVHMKILQIEEYIQIADEYARQWNFPNVIGAIDGSISA